MGESFGFINLSKMAAGDYEFADISYDKIEWAVTKDYNDMAKNHCGAVSVTNLALYFASNGYSNLIIDNNKEKTFAAAHKIVGNGPKIFIARKAKRYFRQRGYLLEYEKVKSFEAIKDAISMNQPMAVLLSNGFFSWHWILVVGYRQYKNDANCKENYMRIVDSWNSNPDRFYKVNSGSRLWSTTKYWIKPL